MAKKEENHLPRSPPHIATLLISNGIDIYTVSKMLTHKNVATTQIYAEVVNQKKHDAANSITLK
ncbi:MAG: tyrosine-type recombinase/integrase [Bacteroidales bacterium]|nr:tyrosine-type recombinase/integrase [Bacteroidales bacterium]